MIMGKRLDDHPRAVGLKRLMDVCGRSRGVAHVVQAVEEGHKIVGSWIGLGRSDLEPCVVGDSGLLSRSARARLRDRDSQIQGSGNGERLGP
jgi:hypothetical protein